MPTQTEMKGQEWTQITFTKPKSAVKPAETMKAAQRAGNVLQERKHNHATTAAGLSARALDEDTETLKHATVSTDLKLAIMKARTAKGQTQKQLAAQLNLQPQVINEYERGTAIPNNAVIARIEKALGAKLPRAPKR